ncbi:uncharacterized protein VTP21DRAFT_8209 [Calcarisporiella thermophila]|uniref:uncharacterized protein n=1 Tax=Calcarisporiella thermophila TaxID=911321 RepID=UPI003742C274
MTNTLSIVYATYEGHTRIIAERIANRIRDKLRNNSNWKIDVVNCNAIKEINKDTKAVILGSPIYFSKLNSSLVQFARRNANTLNNAQIRAMFVNGGSLAPSAADQKIVDNMINNFVNETGYNNQFAGGFGGAYHYSTMIWWKKFALSFAMGSVKSIFEKAKLEPPTNMNKDYDYTDWNAVQQWADEVVDRLPKK